MELTNFKKVDRVSELLTFGYIRQYSNDLNVKYDIPTLIMQICTIFYYISDEWDKIMTSEQMKIFDNKWIKKGGSWTNAFLQRIVDKNNGYKHHWRFKIIKRVSWLFIGIFDVKFSKECVDENGRFNKTCIVGKYWGYCFDAVQRRVNINKHATSWTQAGTYGIKTECGDIVDMYLDFKSLELSFAVNDVNYGKSHHIRDASYKAAICSFGSTTEIEFLHYYAFYE